MANDKKISELPITETINASDRSILISNNADYQFDFATLLQFINAGLNSGANLTFGPVLPQNTVGKNGDVFINTSAGSFAQKIAGAWMVVYTVATGGTTDTTVLYGTTVPGTTTGNSGDTFINTVSGIFYKKTGVAWNQVFSMQTGPQGPQGAIGTNGTNGSNGKTILNGTTNPANSLGTDGDFYINTASYYLFGPKAAGIWGTGISLIVSGVQFEETDNKNTPNGYAGLDGSGKVVAAQLPSYVDDVLEVANYASLPATGETGKIYITIDTNNEYRWSGSTYIQIVASPGSTDAVPEGTTNKYFTVSRVLTALLTGVGFGTATAVTATDTILQAFGKLQAQITALFKIPAGGTTGQVLAKVNDVDGNVHWVDAAAGGGGYTLPIATNTVLGGVKQGANVIVTEDGTLNAITGAANSNLLLSVDSFHATWNYLLGNTADITIDGDCRISLDNVPNFACAILIVRQSSIGNATLRLPNGSRREIGFALSTAANAVDMLAIYFDGNYYYWSICKSFDIPTQDLPYMVWQNLINTTFDGTTLTKINSEGWNGSALGSKKVQLAGTGEQGRLIFDHLVPGGAIVVGFSNTVGDSSYGSIQYAFYWDTTNNFNIYESGTIKGSGSLISGTTKMEIVVSNIDVKYYKDDVLIYSSLTAPSFPLFIDISMNNIGATLENVQLTGNLIDA